MDLVEFQQNFEKVAICQIRDSFGSAFQSIDLNSQNWKVIGMNVADVHEEIFLTVSQKEKKRSYSSSDYSGVRLVLT
jgi:hypothetical protein